MLTKLHLYGPLADEYGAVHPVAANTIFDALRIVDCNFPGFLLKVRRGKFHVANGKRRLRFNKKTGSVSRGKSLARELHQHHLALPRTNPEWHLVPALTGGKSRTFKTIFSIVVGGALLATGIGGALGAAQIGSIGGTSINLGLSAGLGMSTGVLGLSYGTVALMGAAFFLGGINMLLTPTPKGDTSEKKPTSFSFDGPGEIDDEGGPIPILIGELIIGQVRVASSVESTGTASIIDNNGGKWGAMFQAIGGSGGQSSGGSGGMGGSGGGFDLAIDAMEQQV